MAEYIWNYDVAIQQSEKCIKHMMQNSFICRVGWAGVWLHVAFSLSLK